MIGKVVSGPSVIDPVNKPIYNLYAAAKKLEVAQTYSGIFRNCDVEVTAEVVDAPAASTAMVFWGLRPQEPSTGVCCSYDVSQYAEAKGLPIEGGKMAAYPKGKDQVFECPVIGGGKLTLVLENGNSNKPLDSTTFQETVGKAIEMMFATMTELNKFAKHSPVSVDGRLEYNPATRKAEFNGFMKQQIERVESDFMERYGLNGELSKKDQEKLEKIKNALYETYMDILSEA